jgi:hypothetical protein
MIHLLMVGKCLLREASYKNQAAGALLGTRREIPSIPTTGVMDSPLVLSFRKRLYSGGFLPQVFFKRVQPASGHPWRRAMLANATA